MSFSNANPCCRSSTVFHAIESALVADTRSHNRVMSHDGDERESRKLEIATSYKKQKRGHRETG